MASTGRLQTSIKLYLAPVLREDGFRGSGRTFRCVSSDFVEVINVQGNRFGGSFAINLAVHPLAIPDLLGNQADAEKISEELCEFRRRLSTAEERSDFWWKHDGTQAGMDAAMREAAKVYEQVGRSLMQKIAGLESPIRTATPDDVAKGSNHFFGFGFTKTRTALALARFRIQTNRLEEAKAIARVGLANDLVDGPIKDELMRMSE